MERNKTKEIEKFPRSSIFNITILVVADSKNHEKLYKPLTKNEPAVKWKLLESKKWNLSSKTTNVIWMVTFILDYEEIRKMS